MRLRCADTALWAARHLPATQRIARIGSVHSFGSPSVKDGISRRVL
jgi:hypothetical protein